MLRYEKEKSVISSDFDKKEKTWYDYIVCFILNVFCKGMAY